MDTKLLSINVLFGVIVLYTYFKYLVILRGSLYYKLSELRFLMAILPTKFMSIMDD